METKANYVIVGIFTLVALFAAFAFVYWTATVGSRGETVPLLVRIPGSASGLSPASLVMFNGVKVGNVERVRIDINDPSIVIAETVVDRLTPITNSTKADIGIAGLSGQANIELRGAKVKEGEIKLLEEAEEHNTIAQITASPSAVTNLLETAQDIFTRADKVLTNLEGVITDVRAPLTQTIKNAETFSQALADNSDGVDDFLASVTKLSTQLAGASDKLESTLDAAEGLIRAVDKDDVRKIVENVEKVTEDLRDTGKQIDGIVARVDGAVKSISEFADGARDTLASVDRIVASVDPQAVKKTIGNIESASAGADKVIGDVSRVTTTLAERADDIDRIIGNVETASEGADRIIGDVSRVTTKAAERADDIDRFIADASQLAERLNKASGKVDEILASVDPRAIDQTIGNIEKASKGANKVVEDVSRVTSKFAEHADDVDTFMADATQLADRLNQASVRVDGILAKVDSLLGDENTKGLVTEASETLKSFKQVADTLNSRLGTIMDGISQFSNQGLRDVEALVRDSRRSINRIEEAVSDFERNPQRILTGGDGTVRQYDGRVRR
jgi:phospholipid/cholesterol/gamma-HCH transport system substrate-binding protein